MFLPARHSAGNDHPGARQKPARPQPWAAPFLAESATRLPWPLGGTSARPVRVVRAGEPRQTLTGLSRTARPGLSGPEKPRQALTGISGRGI